MWIALLSLSLIVNGTAGAFSPSPPRPPLCSHMRRSSEEQRCVTIARERIRQDREAPCGQEGGDISPVVQ